MPRGLVGLKTTPEEVLEALRRALEGETEVKKATASFASGVKLPSWLRNRELLVYKGRRFYLVLAVDEGDEEK